MSNVVDSAKGFFSEELVGRLVPFLGVESEQMRSLIDAAIGALSPELSKVGAGPQVGLTTVADFDAIWRPEGGLIALAQEGKSILSTVLGDQQSDVVSQVSAHSGVKAEAVEKALCVVAPALVIAGAGLGNEKPVEAPSTPQKRRITVGKLEEVQEAVVAPTDAPAPVPMNIPLAQPEMPIESTPSVSSAPAPSKAQKRLLPALAAVVCAVALGATVLMKGCDSGAAGAQPKQSASVSGEPKLEDPAFPVNPDQNGANK